MSDTSNKVWTFDRKNAGDPQQSVVEEILRRYCEKNGYRVAGHSILDGTDEEVLAKVKQIASENELHTVVFSEKEQLSENCTNLVNALQELKFHNIQLELVQAPHRITEQGIFIEEVERELMENPIDWDTVSANNDLNESKKLVWTFVRETSNQPIGNTGGWEEKINRHCKEKGYHVVGHSRIRGTNAEFMQAILDVVKKEQLQTIIVPNPFHISSDMVDLVWIYRNMNHMHSKLEFLDGESIYALNQFVIEFSDRLKETLYLWDKHMLLDGVPNYYKFMHSLYAYYDSLSQEAQQLSLEIPKLIAGLSQYLDDFPEDEDVGNLTAEMGSRIARIDEKKCRLESLQEKIAPIKKLFHEANIPAR